jgi:hypothetical protein
VSTIPTWWTNAASPALFTVVGATVSLYATVVLERYNRFNEILRRINHARRRAEIYPIDVSDLERARDEGLDYWHLLEHARDDMEAEGQRRAAKRIAVLVGFAYVATAKMEAMLNDSRDALKVPAVSTRLSAFQSEFNRIKNADLDSFEDSVKGERRVFYKPLPEKPTADRTDAIYVDYFEDI